MYTNIFRLGGLQTVSWFQLLPDSKDQNLAGVKNPRDRAFAGAKLVLEAHLHLQNEGQLSSWTAHSLLSEQEANVKLWLFIPGWQENNPPVVQPSLSGLVVAGTGRWRSPGNCEEVTFALCQALQNRFERALNLFGYGRFGDFFVKCKQLASMEITARKSLPSVEMHFAASEEAIFVHFVICRRRLRPLATSDMHATRYQQLAGDAPLEKNVSVLVSPYGMIGQLTGCYPGELVRRLYQSKKEASDDYHVTRNTHLLPCTFGNRATFPKSWYAEVRLSYFSHRDSIPPGCLSSPEKKVVRQQADHSEQIPRDSKEDKGKEGFSHGIEEIEQSFLFPLEAILVPLGPPISPRVFQRRCWLQNWSGTSWIESLPFGDKFGSIQQPCERSGPLGSVSDLTGWTNGSYQPKSSSSYSSSSSGGSSIKSSSSIGTSGTDSEVEGAENDGGLKADADSIGNACEKSDYSLLLDSDGGIAESNLLPASNTLKRERSKLLCPPDDAPAKTPKKSNTLGAASGVFIGGSISTSKSLCNEDEMNALLLGLQSNNAAGTAKNAINQAGISWDWNQEDKGIGMEMQTDADFFAEFGDFGDFFEDDDALGFGEPPGTAESQALMFSLADCGEGTHTPGTVSLDTSDPMLLPILDFPMLEGFGQEIVSKELNYLEPDDEKVPKETFALSSQCTPSSESNLTKAEAVILFSPEYVAVDLPLEKSYEFTSRQSSYVPTSCKFLPSCNEPDSYVYGASPPLETGFWRLGPGVKNRCEEIQGIGRGTHYTSMGQTLQSSASNKNKIKPDPQQKLLEVLSGNNPRHYDSIMSISSGAMHEKSKSALGVAKVVQECRFVDVPVLASELECALFHIKVGYLRGFESCCDIFASCKLNYALAVRNTKGRNAKLERTLDTIIKQSRASVRQYEQRKKDHIPVRIAGDVDDRSHDGPRTEEIGVWRSVVTRKSPNVGDSSENHLSGFGSSSSSVGTTKPSPADCSIHQRDLNTNQWEEALVTIPLLVQQALIPNDVSLNGDYRDGPLDWLELHPHARPPSVCVCNYGMNGSFNATSAHADKSSIEAVNPLVAEVSFSTVASLLQADVRQAMAAAFGDLKLAGPLKVADWCRGRITVCESTQIGDSSSAGCGYSDSKELASSVTVAIGEPITPPQCTGGAMSASKLYASLEGDNQGGDCRRSRTNRTLDASPMSDHTATDAQKRTNPDLSIADTETQASGASHSPTVALLPIPALLVGYQDDWLKVSSSSLCLWEKAPLEPYALPKPVTYYVVSVNSEPLLSAASYFFQQLSTVYEACRLGTHSPASLTTTFGRHSMQGLLTVDVFPNENQANLSSSSLSLASAHVMNMDCGWNLDDFRKSLRKVFTSLQVLDKSALLQRDPEHSPCVVVYVLSPSGDPAILLQILMDACEGLGLSAGFADDYNASRKAAGSATLNEYILSVPTLFGFANARLALQLLSPDVIFKLSNTHASGSDFLKDIAFGVYNKVRRLPQKFSNLESVQSTSLVKTRTVATTVSQTSGPMSGVWKDCSTVMPGGSASFPRENTLDLGLLRSCNWDNSRPSSRFSEMGMDSSTAGSERRLLQSTIRFLYEPLFILAVPGSLDHGIGCSLQSIRSKDRFGGALDESAGTFHINRGSVVNTAESAPAITFEPDMDNSDSTQHHVSSFHCCYAWTDDWQWLVSVWTDSRGELLDIHMYPLLGISRPQDEKRLQFLFLQVLEQGLQLISAAPLGINQSHNIVIARVGEFYEFECQEWQRAFGILGGDDIRSWSVQIVPSASDHIISAGTNSLEQREVTTAPERNPTLANSSAMSPSNMSLLGSRNVASVAGIVKGDRLLGSSSKMLSSCLQLVQSFSLVTVQMDHTLQILHTSDTTPPPGPQVGSLSSLTLSKPLPTPVGAFMIVPDHGLRYLSRSACSPSQPSNLPYIAKVLSSKGLCNPVSSGWVLSGTPSVIESPSNHIGEGWPCTLHVALVMYFNRHNQTSVQDANARMGGGNGLCESTLKFKNKKVCTPESKEYLIEAQNALGSLIAELHALSWLNVSPTFPRRISPLPFHCSMALRLKKLIEFMDSEIGLSSLQS